MIVNTKKFQAMLLLERFSVDLTICINDVVIKPKNSVKPLGITFDNKLNFENRISTIIVIKNEKAVWK